MAADTSTDETTAARLAEICGGGAGIPRHGFGWGTCEDEPSPGAHAFRKRLIAARHAALVKLAPAAWEEIRADGGLEGLDAQAAAQAFVEHLANHGLGLPYPKPTTAELRELAALVLPHVDPGSLLDVAEHLPHDALVLATRAGLPRMKRAGLLAVLSAYACGANHPPHLWFVDRDAAGDHDGDVESFARIDAVKRWDI